VTPAGKITLPTTFETQENFHTEYMQFKVAILTKFMTIPHYVYLVLKMLNPNGVISIKGDVKRTHNYD
jgi:hypothetical protein